MSDSEAEYKALVNSSDTCHGPVAARHNTHGYLPVTLASFKLIGRGDYLEPWRTSVRATDTDSQGDGTKVGIQQERLCADSRHQQAEELENVWAGLKSAKKRTRHCGSAAISNSSASKTGKS
jgi:hypothetical protein